MEASPSTTTHRVGTIRSSKWAMGIIAMLLSISLILSACGSEGAGTDPTLSEPASGDVPVVPDEGGIDDSEGITETE